jgi:hypothetical protein
MTVPKEMNNRRTTEKDIREVIRVVAVVVLFFGIPCVPARWYLFSLKGFLLDD